MSWKALPQGTNIVVSLDVQLSSIVVVEKYGSGINVSPGNGEFSHPASSPIDTLVGVHLVFEFKRRVEVAINVVLPPGVAPHSVDIASKCAVVDSDESFASTCDYLVEHTVVVGIDLALKNVLDLKLEQLFVSEDVPTAAKNAIFGIVLNGTVKTGLEFIEI